MLKQSQKRMKRAAFVEASMSKTPAWSAGWLGYIDEIILPSQTREKLIQALDMTHTKIRSNPAKKHGNIPL